MQKIRRVLTALKYPQAASASFRLPVRVRGTPVAYLRAIPACLGGESSCDAHLMTKWRNTHREAFFTWREWTEISMREWLATSYGPDGEDILFMVVTPEGRPFGHMALSNFVDEGRACEFGRVLRGSNAGPENGMTWAASALLHWAHSALGVERFFLEVLQNNDRAIAMYERLGFRVTSSVLLTRESRGAVTRWVRQRLGESVAPDAHAYAMDVAAAKVCTPDE